MKKLDKVSYTTDFIAHYNRRVRRYPKLKQLFLEALDMFLANPYDQLLETHRLRPPMTGSWSFKAGLGAYDMVVIFRPIDGWKRFVLMDIGTHSEVYRRWR